MKLTQECVMICENPGTYRFCAPLLGEVEPRVLWIECYKSMALPSFQIVGLPGPEISEARERIRAAIESSGLLFPDQKVLLNLSPANVRKQGTGLDLAMALAVLLTETPAQSSQQIVLAWGELSLGGELRDAGQTFRALISALHAKADVVVFPKQCREQVCADQAYLEALLLECKESEFQSPLFENTTLGLLKRRGWPRMVFAQTVGEAHYALWSGENLPIDAPEVSTLPAPVSSSDSTRLQSDKTAPALLPLSPIVARILGVSLAGFHHLLLLGARGTGKSQAFEWVPSLLPIPSAGSQIQNRLTSELRGEGTSLGDTSSWIRRVGQQVRAAALIGGVGARGGIRPGEFTLAHGGILLADEFPEWGRDARESLREPLERRKVSLTRANGSVELPADFLLLANGNLCPCGGLPRSWVSVAEKGVRGAAGVTTPLCSCTELEQTRYRSRMSGPVMDRLDLVVKVVPDLQEYARSPTDALELQKRILTVRERLMARYGGLPGQLSGAQLEVHLDSNPSFAAAVSAEPFSSLRARHKAIRVAMTLAEWDDVTSGPGSVHLREAQCYRPEALGLTQGARRG